MNFGIVGCGMIANFHADAINSIEDAVLIGFSDVHYNSAVSLANKYNAIAYESYEKMLENEDIDIVCVCTPSGFHVENAMKALGYNKHVVIEKPMALNKQDAEKLINESKKRNRLITVISQFRFYSDIRKLKTLIAQGELGDIVSVDLNMMFFRAPDYYINSTWKGTWSLDGGELMNQGIHGVDLMKYLVGPVKTVKGISKTLFHKIEAEDTSAAVIEFENGALGTIISTVAARCGYERRLTVCGTKGSAIICQDTLERLDLENESYKRSDCAEERDVSNPGSIDTYGHIIQLKNMIDAIEKGEQLLITPEDHCETLDIIWSAGKCGYIK